MLLYLDGMTEFQNTCGPDMTCGQWFIGYVLSAVSVVVS
jgi:hypothetical protein